MGIGFKVGLGIINLFKGFALNVVYSQYIFGQKVISGLGRNGGRI
jgi:hypothetical protein